MKTPVSISVVKINFVLIYFLESYETLCTIRADTSNVKAAVVRGPFGIIFMQEYDVVLSCGKTELTAYIRWTEDVSRSLTRHGDNTC